MAALAAGMWLTSRVVVHTGDSDPSCVTIGGSCFWQGVGGNLLGETGAVIFSIWAWKLGESRATSDFDSGQHRRAGLYKWGGLTTALLALATADAGAFFAAFGWFGCIDNGRPDNACISGKEHVPITAALVAQPIMVAGAALAGYGFGYSAGMTAAEKRPPIRLLLLPVPSREGVLFALGARF